MVPASWIMSGHIWCTPSVALTVRGGWGVTRWFCNMFRVFLVKKHATFKWKDAISRFPVSPGSAEALLKWGGKIKHHLIAHFLSNVCAKKCQNRFMSVRVIPRKSSDIFFWETVYTRTQMALIGISFSELWADMWQFIISVNNHNCSIERGSIQCTNRNRNLHIYKTSSLLTAWRGRSVRTLMYPAQTAAI